MTSSRPASRPLLLLLSSVLVGGCSAPTRPSADDGGSGARDAAPQTCSDRTWRQARPGEVACPGTSTCGCAGSVCCIEGASGTVTSSACSDVMSCRGAVFACDGPEDCGAGATCCIRSGSTSAECAADCLGGLTLCHGDVDCSFGACLPSESGPFAGLVGGCR